MVLNLIVTECGQVKPELSKLLHQTAPPAEVSVSFAEFLRRTQCGM